MKKITKERLVAEAMKLWAAYGNCYRTAVDDYLRMYEIYKKEKICIRGGPYLKNEVLENYPENGFLDIEDATEARQFLGRLTPAGIMVVIDSVKALEFDYYYNSVRNVNKDLRYAIKQIGKRPSPFGVSPDYCQVKIVNGKNRRHLAD